MVGPGAGPGPGPGAGARRGRTGPSAASRRHRKCCREPLPAGGEAAGLSRLPGEGRKRWEREGRWPGGDKVVKEKAVEENALWKMRAGWLPRAAGRDECAQAAPHGLVW